MADYIMMSVDAGIKGFLRRRVDIRDKVYLDNIYKSYYHTAISCKSILDKDELSRITRNAIQKAYDRPYHCDALVVEHYTNRIIHIYQIVRDMME